MVFVQDAADVLKKAGKTLPKSKKIEAASWMARLLMLWKTGKFYSDEANKEPKGGKTSAMGLDEMNRRINFIFSLSETLNLFELFAFADSSIPP